MIGKVQNNVRCETCNARKDSLFCMYKGDDLKKLDSNRSCSQIKKGQSLFNEGGIPRGVFCLNEGKVKIYTRGEEGKEQIIHIATKGEIVGFRAMFSGDPYIVSAETLEESNVCFISKEDFTDLIDTNADLRNGILKELSLELAERASFVTAMAQKSVRERLASVLLMLDTLYADELINLSREDLANYVGTATETLIRLLKDFKDEGLLQTHVRKIELLEKAKIAEIAGV